MAMVCVSLAIAVVTQLSRPPLKRTIASPLPIEFDSTIFLSILLSCQILKHLSPYQARYTYATEVGNAHQGCPLISIRQESSASIFHAQHRIIMSAPYLIICTFWQFVLPIHNPF